MDILARFRRQPKPITREEIARWVPQERERMIRQMCAESMAFYLEHVYGKSSEGKRNLTWGSVTACLAIGTFPTITCFRKSDSALICLWQQEGKHDTFQWSEAQDHLDDPDHCEDALRTIFDIGHMF